MEKREGDTCLHKGVRFVNGLDKSEWGQGAGVVEILIDAGCDPRYVCSQACFENVDSGDDDAAGVGGDDGISQVLITSQDTEQSQAATD